MSDVGEEGALSPDEIRERLAGYDSVSIDRVINYLTSLLELETGRADVIDTKANVILGFAAASVALVAGWVLDPGRQFPLFVSCLIGAGALSCLVAVPLAFLAMAARRQWPRLKDTDAFPAFTPDDGAPRDHAVYWVLALRGLARSTTENTNRKGKHLLGAQMLLALGVLLIGVGLAGLVIDRGALPSVTP